MNQTLLATSRGVALLSLCMVAGCGFSPKEPPMPNPANAIPVNQSLPDTRPWSEIYPPIALRAPSPPDQKIVLAQATTSAAIAAETHPGAQAKSDDKLHVKTGSGSAAKSKAVTLDVPVPKPPLPAPPGSVTALNAKAKAQSHDLAGQRQMPGSEMIAVERLPAHTFGLPSSKVDPLLMAAISPVLVKQPVMPGAQSAEPHSMAPVAKASAQPLSLPRLAEDSKANAEAVLAGKIVTRDLTPSEPLPAAATQKLPTKLAASQSVTAVLPDPATPPVPPAPRNVAWSASAGTSLSDVVRNWGYQETPHWWVVWNTKSDFKIGSPYTIQAPDFLTAATQLFATARQENYFFTVVKHPNHVLVVSTPTE